MEKNDADSGKRLQASCKLASSEESQVLASLRKVMENLNSMRHAGELCDVILVAKESKFPAHKSILAAHSPFFKGMFMNQMLESQQLEVPLQDIEPEILEIVLKYMYTSVTTTSSSNAESLLSSASFFQMDQLCEGVCLFLQDQINSDNCLGLWDIADSYSCTELVEKARNHSLKNFEDVCLGDEFTMLSCEKVIELIRSDDLVVKGEETVMNSALRWLNHNHDERQTDFHKVLQHVRLAQLNPYYMHDNLVNIPAVKSSSECMQLVHEAKDYHLLSHRRHLMQSLSCKRRKCFSTMQGIVAGVASSKKNPSIHLYSPLTQEWRELDSVPQYITLYGLVSSDNCTFYLAGGSCTDGLPSRLAWRYHPQSSNWLEIASMSVGRKYPGLATSYGYVYAVGGYATYTEKWLTSVERYSPCSNTWSTVKPMPEVFAYPRVVAYKGMLYVIGHKSNSVLRYNLITDVWETLESMPNPAWRSCIVEGCIYVISSGATNFNSFDIEKNKCWEGREPAPFNFLNGGICVFNGCIYFFASKPEMACVACYDPRTNKWETLGKLPQYLHGLSLRCSALY